MRIFSSKLGAYANAAVVLLALAFGMWSESGEPVGGPAAPARPAILAE